MPTESPSYDTSEDEGFFRRDHKRFFKQMPLQVYIQTLCVVKTWRKHHTTVEITLHQQSHRCMLRHFQHVSSGWFLR